MNAGMTFKRLTNLKIGDEDVEIRTINPTFSYTYKGFTSRIYRGIFL